MIYGAIDRKENDKMIEQDVMVKGKLVEIDRDNELSHKVKFEDGRYVCFKESSVYEKSKTYEDGLNEAWELAKKVMCSPNTVENARIFIDKTICGIEFRRLADEFFSLTPQEALAKMKAYEKEKEIKVGDVVTNDEQQVEILVTVIYESGYFDGMKFNSDDELGKKWATYSGMHLRNFKKTGKHIDFPKIFDEIGKE